ncbi:MAG: hypothetical protein CMJ35_02865 [Phycisphaerae bacterium]|nr:hypothetical protein [Phycisphaerae bacterium]MBM90541.1 hypothetical protein [Phycisphaerae bacterium]HCT44813.1 hypothetical protein [Phycisphaerales bacterium]
MNKKLLASALLGSAILVGAIAIVRVSRVQTPSPVLPDPGVDYRQEFTNTRDGDGDRYSRAQTREDFRKAVDAKLAGAGVERAEQASALLALRADLLFDPDFERWSAYAGGLHRNARSGWVVPSEPDFRERWEMLAAAYRDPVIDTDRLWVEHIDPFRSFPETQPGTICMRNTSKYSAPYPFHVPEEDRAEAEGIEVFVPAQIRDMSGKPVNVTLSFVLVREQPRAEWKERDMFVYIGSEGFGRDLPQPPF